MINQEGEKGGKAGEGRGWLVVGGGGGLRARARGIGREGRRR